MPMPTLLHQFQTARRRSVPLISLITADPAATLDGLVTAVPEAPLLRWDSVQGLVGVTPEAQALLASLIGGPFDRQATADPVQALMLAQKLPPDSVLVCLNTHRWVEQAPVAQAIWNLRNPFKTDGRTLVLLSPAGLSLPAELQQDLIHLDEPLPEDDARQQIATALHDAADLPPPPEDVRRQVLDATRGLSAFAAEQAMALSLTPQGMDLPRLWGHKHRFIEATPGLAVWRGGETFAAIGGLAHVKTFLRRLLQGRGRPGALVFIDELEKALAGASGPLGDSSGVSQTMLGFLLSYMQDTQASGLLFLGPPGSGKSQLAKAAGHEAGLPTIVFDLPGMKSSLVGESEARLRQALKVVTAISHGTPLFIATCNALSQLPPELRRRFTCGTFFFDLPDPEEQRAIWAIYLQHYQLPPQELPPHQGWTGAEIRQCCDLAWRLECSLREAASYLVPVIQSAGEQIDQLRQQAHGRFISASDPGPYHYPTTPAAPARKLALYE